MPEDRDDILVQQYLQGDLEPAERDAVRERLRSDQSLRELLEYYTLLGSDLRSLEGEDDRVPADLWKRRIRPAMAAAQRPAGEERRSGNPFAFLFGPAMRPVLIAASFVVIVVSATLFLQQQVLTEPQQPYARALGRIEELRIQFVSELNVLLAEMDDRKPQMTPEMRTVYETTLTQIDEAIANAERFYAFHSDDQDAIQLLMAAYDHKAEFLQTFVNMEL